MSVITFANTKGGAGKTTAVLLLATELARSGHRVTVLDADPQLWISRWHELSGEIENLSVISHVTIASLEGHIRENKTNTDCFIIDLPGAKTPLLTMALGISDHVLIPVQGSAMDARGAAEVLDHIEFLNRRMGKEIAHSIVLTRVNAMVATRSLLLVKMLLAERTSPCSIRRSSSGRPIVIFSTMAARSSVWTARRSAISTRRSKTRRPLPRKSSSSCRKDFRGVLRT